MSPDERKWFQLLERATIALEKIAKIEAPNKPAAPVRTEAEQLEARRKNVSVVSRARTYADGPDDRGLTRGACPLRFSSAGASGTNTAGTRINTGENSYSNNRLAPGIGRPSQLWLIDMTSLLAGPAARAGARGCGRRVSAPVWRRGTRS